MIYDPRLMFYDNYKQFKVNIYGRPTIKNYFKKSHFTK